MKRMFLFLATNLAVVALLGIIYAFLAPFIEPALQQLGIPYSGLLAFALFFGMSGSFVSLLMSKTMAKMAYKIKTIKTLEEAQTAHERFMVIEVQKLAEQAGINMPEVGVYISPEPNAFATGASKNKSMIAASSGLLDGMSETEARAVLAHEMSHITNGDMVTMTLMQGVLNTFVIFFARIVAGIISNIMRNDEGEGVGGFAYFGIVFVLEMVFGFLASLITFAYSRRREYYADSGSADYLGSAQPMIAALRKLATLTNRAPVDPRGQSLETLKIGGRERRSFLRTHPTLEDRIASLENWTADVSRA